jgi:hypothetical protein
MSRSPVSSFGSPTSMIACPASETLHRVTGPPRVAQVVPLAPGCTHAQTGPYPSIRAGPYRRRCNRFAACGTCLHAGPREAASGMRSGEGSANR